MSAPTPIVDAVLGDPIAIPSNVDVWLRTIERRARMLRARVEESFPGEEAIPLLVDARAALAAFLEDPASSALHRIIRRPLPQLAGGTPAHQSFTRLTEFLFRRAEDALEMQAATDALRREVDGVRRQFEARSPYFTGVHLRAARVDEADLLRARRVPDLRAIEARLGRAKAALERIAARLPPEREAREGDWEMTEGSEASADELRAALAIGLLVRSAAEKEGATLERLRGIVVRQLHELGGLAQWNRPARRSLHLVAEHFAAEAARAGDSLARHGEDTGLWGELLRASQAALYDPDDEAGWQPRVRAASAGEELAAGATLWMIPVDEAYVLLTPELRSAVRVASRGVGLGKTIECRLFGTPDMPVSTRVAKLDVVPFFEGVDLGEPGWYKTRRNARFEVVGHRGANWFARLKQRGEARRLRTAGWEDSASETGAVRVVVPASVLPSGVTIETGPSGAPAVSFQGFQTQEVRTPLFGQRVGWLRTATGRSAAEQQALEREAELFRLLGRHSVSLAPLRLGRARLAGTVAAGFLYERPYALRLHECPPLEQWLHQGSRTAFMRAVSRLLAAVHDAGYALGVCHLDAFAFGMEWPRPGAPPLPRATLVHAPYATRLEQSFDPPASDAANTLRYPRIRFTGLPLPVTQGWTALPQTDAAAFALFALEMLAEKPLPVTPGWLGWGDLPGAVVKHAEHCFARPKLAVELARDLADERRWGSLLQWQREMAVSRPPPGAGEQQASAR